MVTIPHVVLDTNVVLDWLVFEDRELECFARAVAARRIRVLTNALARAELTRVLGYPALRLTSACQAQVLERYRTSTESIVMPDGFRAGRLLLPEAFPRCRDSDDDAFLALAFHARASALVTRDKSLLKLRRRAAGFAVTICDVRQLSAMLDPQRDKVGVRGCDDSSSSGVKIQNST